MTVCALDGVPVMVARSGQLIHLDAIPKELDFDHAIVAIRDEEFERRAEKHFDVKGAAEDMVAHHATLHPISDCEWAQRLVAALRS